MSKGKGLGHRKSPDTQENATLACVHLNEIKILVSSLHVLFQHVHGGDGFVDVLAKEGTSRSSPFDALII